MDFAITSTGKAKNVLKYANVSLEQIIDGRNGKMIIEANDVINQILNHGEYNGFKMLDKAGKYLKESRLTRSTSHKKYDFSSLQSTSSLNLQQFYKSILDANYDENFRDDGKATDKVSQQVAKEVDALGKKLTKSLNNAMKIIKNNPALAQMVKEDLNQLKTNSQIMGKLNDLLPDNITFSEDAKKTARNHLAKKFFLSAPLAGLGVGTIATLGIFGVEMGYVLSNPALAFFICFFGLGGVLIENAIKGGLICNAAIAAGLIVAGIVVLCDKERFGTIMAKKEAIKIGDEFRNALKYLNKAAFLVRNATQSNGGKAPKPTDEQLNTLNVFIKKQSDLWKPYTSVGGREYKKLNNQKHKNGLIYVKNEKTSTLGKMKEGIAKTWAELKIER